MPFLTLAQKSGITIFAGFNHALGDFYSVDLEKNDWALASRTSTKCGAGSGFDIGLNYCIPLDSAGFINFTASVDFLYTESNSEVTTSMYNMIFDATENFDKVSISAPNYKNLPVLLGLRFMFPKEKVNLYFDAQLGATYRWTKGRIVNLVGGKEPFTIDVNEAYYDFSYRDHFDSGLSYAFHLSVGVIGKKHWTIDLGVWHLGTSRLSGYEDFEIRTEENPNTVVKGSQSITAGEITPLLATFRVGYNFSLAHHGCR